MKQKQYQLHILAALLLCVGVVACGPLRGSGRTGRSRTSSPGANRVPPARTNNSYNQYIDRYALVAIESQKRYNIPASIILAQGLLESGAGNSKLAREANNHFGIKCHNSWRGARTYHNDDRPNECFRAYASAEDSYKDHGEFLQKPRYARLFKLSPHDYQGWAKGLQQCGYATDRGYANKLIKIIEDYRLYLIDRDNPGRHYTFKETTTTPQAPIAKPQPKPAPSNANPTVQGPTRETFISYGLLYVIARQGDDLKAIAHDLGLSERKLARYNDFPEGYPLDQGDIIYLQSKLSKAQPPHYEHVVKVGESIHGIAQRYGLRLEALYSLNNLTPEYIPQEGDVLRLR